MSAAPAHGEPAPWFDPGWLIRRTLTAEAEDAPGVAEDALMAWLVRLSEEHDPAEAAAGVLRAYGPSAPDDDPLADRLFALLHETSRFSSDRLARMQPRRRAQRPA